MSSSCTHPPSIQVPRPLETIGENASIQLQIPIKRVLLTCWLCRRCVLHLFAFDEISCSSRTLVYVKRRSSFPTVETSDLRAETQRSARGSFELLARSNELKSHRRHFERYGGRPRSGTEILGEHYRAGPARYRGEPVRTKRINLRQRPRPRIPVEQHAFPVTLRRLTTVCSPDSASDG